MFHYYLAVLKKYAVFSGRARRAEYWYFFLANFLISLVIRGAISIGTIRTFRAIVSIIGTGSEGVSIPGWIYPLSIFYTIYALAVLIPSIAVGVRRMHDINKSGWFILIPIYNIALAATDGTKGDNKYGPDPKASTS